MQRRHYGYVSETSKPGANDPAWKPPVRVDYVGLEVAARANGVNEIRAEKTDESESRAPGRRDIAGHVPRVRQLLEPTRCVAKTLDRDAFDIVRGWKAWSRWGDDLNFDVLGPQGDR